LCLAPGRNRGLGTDRNYIGPGPRQPCGLCGADEPKPITTIDGFAIARCKVCDVLYVVNPVPPEEMERLYAGDYFGDLGQEHPSEWYPVLEEIDRQRLLRIERLVSPGTILDVGCGTGIFLKGARSKGWETQGVEISSAAAGYAKQKYGLEVMVGKVEDATLPPDSVDVATLWHLVEHLEDPLGTLRCLYGLLKPGGLIVFETPNARDLRGSSHLWRGDGHPRYHRFLFSPQTLRWTLKGAGFAKITTVFWGYRLPPQAVKNRRAQGVRLWAKRLLSLAGRDSVVTGLAWKGGSGPR